MADGDDNEEDFYDAKSEASQIKIRIVTKYFAFWSGFMIPIAAKGPEKRLAYMDFYCGPGCYRDGSPSTPVLILSEAIKKDQLCEMLVTYFNDKDEEHTKALRANIAKIPGIEKLKREITITTEDVDEGFEEQFASKLIPTFTFIDPFGYKGVERLQGRQIH